MADRESSAQVWGAAVVVASALAVVAAYLINGAMLVLAVAGVEVLLLMVYVGRRWRMLHQPPAPRGHRPSATTPDAAHCERCRRAREALDARQARGRAARPTVEQEPWPEAGVADRPSYPRRSQGRAPHERPWTAERAVARSVDRATARRGASGSADRAVRHQ
ncbi:hypothetical protein [Kitasatospora sp. NPDC087314]|uniref:hypothetical protein n=1 Tax=Kitasatospora sp. NPDC087314 TaxID=3364068 RepID=UPI0037FC14CE